MSANYARLYVRESQAVAGERLEVEKGTLDFLLRQAMHAVLTHLLFAEAVEARDPSSLFWDWDWD